MVPLSSAMNMEHLAVAPVSATLPAHRGSLMQPRVVLPYKLLLFDRMVNLMVSLPWHEELNGWLCEW